MAKYGNDRVKSSLKVRIGKFLTTSKSTPPVKDRSSQESFFSVASNIRSDESVSIGSASGSKSGCAQNDSNNSTRQSTVLDNYGNASTGCKQSSEPKSSTSYKRGSTEVTIGADQTDFKSGLASKSKGCSHKFQSSPKKRTTLTLTQWKNRLTLLDFIAKMSKEIKDIRDGGENNKPALLKRKRHSRSHKRKKRLHLNPED